MKWHILTRSSIIPLLAVLVACAGGNGDLEATDAAEEIGPADAASEDVMGSWSPNAPRLPALHVEGRMIRDEYGRTVLLRGANAGNQAKKPPHLPWEGAVFGDAGFDEDLARFYDFPSEWGFNCIRLTVFWEAVEPVRGEYDEDYVAQTRAQVRAAYERGMYVFLDFHQDLYSRILGGSGAPAWALPDPDIEPVPLDDKTWYLKVIGVGGDDVADACDHFWNDVDGVQDAYLDMALWFSKQFADEPGVIGIDLMNEPTPGFDGKEDPETWYEEKLKVFYETLGGAIHAEVPRYILFVESTSMEAAGVSMGTELPRPDLDNMVFAPHYYNTKQFLSGWYDGAIEEIREGLGGWDAGALAWGVPLLLSEYGFHDYSEEGNPEEYLADHYRVMDELLMHGTMWSHEVTTTYWNLEDCAVVDGGWEERPDMADPLSRPYPRYTSGDWVSFEYTPDTHAIELRYITADTRDAPTILILPRRHYSDPPQVTLAFGDWEYRADTMELWIFDRVEDREAFFGQEQVVQVAP